MINHEKHESHENLLYKEECYAIQGAAFEVYREMGCGFVEAVFQESMEKELQMRNIDFAAQKELNIHYKGIKLQQTYKPDIICYEKIILELKAVKTIAPEHRSQVINYLKASGLRLGLLINFWHYPKVEIERIIL